MVAICKDNFGVVSLLDQYEETQLVWLIKFIQHGDSSALVSQNVFVAFPSLKFKLKPHMFHTENEKRHIF